jgi:bifunctional pyridoxal-dependent enzyme with beta-cystathionase and maltose regulon repressor activities
MPTRRLIRSAVMNLHAAYAGALHKGNTHLPHLASQEMACTYLNWLDTTSSRHPSRSKGSFRAFSGLAWLLLSMAELSSERRP